MPRAAPPTRLPTPELIEVKKLRPDPQNPRLKEAGVDDAPKEEEIIRALWKEMAVNELVDSIAANSYFQYEPLFATDDGDGYYTVIEGNRRLAAVKLLRDPALRARLGIQSFPEVSRGALQKLDTLPTIVCTRQQVWQYLGFKHINGPQNWRSYSKAQYIAYVHNTFGVSLEEIANSIGDRHSTVLRLYDALMALEQAERAGVFHRDDRFKEHFAFSHFYIGLTYAGIRKYLGLPEGGPVDDKKNPVPKKKEEQLGLLLRWMFGSKREDLPPIVKSQNPHLRRLDSTVKSESGVSALRKGLPLDVALDISRGDDQLFRESVITAKQALQKARGTVLSGYTGNQDLLVMAEQVSELASDLLADMRGRPLAAKRSASTREPKS